MMTLRARQKVPARSIDSCLVIILGLPPKDPDDDDDITRAEYQCCGAFNLHRCFDTSD